DIGEQRFEAPRLTCKNQRRKIAQGPLDRLDGGGVGIVRRLPDRLRAPAVGGPMLAHVLLAAAPTGGATRDKYPVPAGNARRRDSRLGGRYSAARSATLGSGAFSRIVTNSSAALGWMPIVVSNCFLVAPHLRAMARPWVISGASAPTMWQPSTRSL